MVARYYSAILILLIYSCAPKNLYKRVISDEEIIQTDNSEIQFDGYYYCIFNYNDYNDKTYIMSLLIYEDNFILQTDISVYQGLEHYEKELLSSEFKKYFNNNKNRLWTNYMIKGHSLITQVTHGGGVYAKHVETRVYEILNKDTIKLSETYDLKKIYHSNKNFIFKKFNEKPTLLYWKTK